MKRLLIVVDYQRDFVDGSLGFPEAVALDERIASKIDAYHSADDIVAFTFDSHTNHYRASQEGKYLPIAHCVIGTPGWDLYGKTAEARLERDLAFKKNTFGSNQLFSYLSTTDRASQEEGMNPFVSIELVGVATNICVIANAVIAKTACPEVPIIIDASCTAAPDAQLYNKTLDVCDGLQIKVEHRA